VKQRGCKLSGGRTGDREDSGRAAAADSMLSRADRAADATWRRLADAAIEQRAMPTSMSGTTLSIDRNDDGVSAERATCMHNMLEATDTSGIMSASPGHGSACDKLARSCLMCTVHVECACACVCDAEPSFRK
jgi:hypothetical protein